MKYENIDLEQCLALSSLNIVSEDILLFLNSVNWLIFELQNVLKIIEFLRKPVLEIDSESNQPGNRKSNVYKKLGFEVNISLYNNI